MKYRFDLVEHLTVEDVIEGALLNNHRYTAEPVFATTGNGQLKTPTPEDIAAENEFTERMLARVKERARLAEEARTRSPVESPSTNSDQGILDSGSKT